MFLFLEVEHGSIRSLSKALVSLYKGERFCASKRQIALKISATKP